MVAMFGAMAVLRRIDQEEPLVLLYARVAYLAYVGFTVLVYVILHFRIIARKDTTLLKVSKSSNAPSFSEALQEARKAAEKAEEERKEENKDDDEVSMTSIVASEMTENGDKNNISKRPKNEDEHADEDDKKEEMETITVMEYDLRQLASARRSWVTSSCFLAAVHYHMESVSPLVMSAIMGLLRLISEDPLVQIHLRGAPSVGKLARPFTAEKNPLANLLKDFAPKDTKSSQSDESARPEEDLHDDGDDDDDDETVSTVPNLRDDNIKSDFDDDETGDAKKTQ